MHTHTHTHKHTLLNTVWYQYNATLLVAFLLRFDRTEDEARRAMIDVLKRPVAPKLDGIPPRPPQRGGNTSGESDTDIEDDEHHISAAGAVNGECVGNAAATLGASDVRSKRVPGRAQVELCDRRRA